MRALAKESRVGIISQHWRVEDGHSEAKIRVYTSYGTYYQGMPLEVPSKNLLSHCNHIHSTTFHTQRRFSVHVQSYLPFWLVPPRRNERRRLTALATLTTILWRSRRTQKTPATISTPQHHPVTYSYPRYLNAFPYIRHHLSRLMLITAPFPSPRISA